MSQVRIQQRTVEQIRRASGFGFHRNSKDVRSPAFCGLRTFRRERPLGSVFFWGPVHRHWMRRHRGRHELPGSSKAHQNHHQHHCLAARVLVLHVRGLAKTLPGIMAGVAHDSGAARRRRERRLRSHWRHGQMAIQVAAFSHPIALQREITRFTSRRRSVNISRTTSTDV